jgi:hypothetical protein
MSQAISPHVQRAHHGTLLWKSGGWAPIDFKAASGVGLRTLKNRSIEPTEVITVLLRFVGRSAVSSESRLNISMVNV